MFLTVYNVKKTANKTWSVHTTNNCTDTKTWSVHTTNNCTGTKTWSVNTTNNCTGTSACSSGRCEPAGWRRWCDPRAAYPDPRGCMCPVNNTSGGMF